MQAHVLEWLNLLVRWVHVIAGIMWIGDSFLFMWLDSHLSPSERSKEPGKDAVVGELWMVHSGGFYEVYKRKYLKPGEMPTDLYWFKWESYTTWLSGALLLIIVYYLGGAAFMVEANGPLSYGAAIATAVGSIAVAWLVYDRLCTTPLTKNLRWFGAFGLVAITAITFGFTRIFNGRAAFLHVGAMLGTIMAANVFFRIIPAQRALLAATKAGTTPDPSLGLRAKMRSTHNHYLTLPVLFTMLSNHFASIWGHPYNWLVLSAAIVLGVSLKRLMITKRQSHPIVIAGAVVSALVVFFVTAPELSGAASDASGPRVTFTEAKRVVDLRCSGCHSLTPSVPGIAVAPNGIVLDSGQKIRDLRERIKIRAVTTKTMPLGNLTAMTDDERALLGRWIDQGAAIE